MMIVFFVLFVLYTLACIADGPDVKPKWKKWLGKKLEKMANRYYPIQYIQRPMPEIDSPFTRQTIQIQPAETKLIKSNAMFRVFPEIMLGERAGRGFSDGQVRFSRCIKEGINHILLDMAKEAFRLGLVKCELVADRHDEVILFGEMKIVEPEHSMFPNPYVLFENSKIEVRYPEPFIDMGLIEEEKAQYSGYGTDPLNRAEYTANEVLDAFIDGYHQAEKDLELTWEDMILIHKCIKDAMNYHLYKMMEGAEGQKVVYKEVLNRFNKLKEK